MSDFSCEAWLGLEDAAAQLCCSSRVLRALTARPDRPMPHRARRGRREVQLGPACKFLLMNGVRCPKLQIPRDYQRWLAAENAPVVTSTSATPSNETEALYWRIDAAARQLFERGVTVTGVKAFLGV